MIFFKKKKQKKPVEFSIKDNLSVEGRVRLAKELLENELLGNIFNELEKEALDVWKTSPTDDMDARECLWHFIKTLEKIKGRIFYYTQEATLIEKSRETLEEGEQNV